MKIIPRRNKVCDNKFISAVFSYLFAKNKRRHNYVKMFEEETARFIGTKYTVLTPTGRKGLSLIIDYYSFPKGAEIILPAYTLKDLAVLIKEKGYSPVFVDINPHTYNIEASLIEGHINEKTVMIIATHLFGMPCEIDTIVEIGRRHNIVVIEDCAHAMGARYKGRRVGSFGEAAFFSLEITKPINTLGGGITVTNIEGLKNYMKNVIGKYPQPKKNMFIKVSTSILEDMLIHSYFFSIFAFLFYFRWTKKLLTRLYLLFDRKVNIKDFAYTNFQAFLGLRQLSVLDERNRICMEKIGRMRISLKNCIDYQRDLFGSTPAFYFNVIKTNNHCEIMRKRLLRKGIDIGIQDEIADNCPLYFKSNLIYPVINDCYSKLLQLPLSADFDDRIIQKIASAVNTSL